MKLPKYSRIALFSSLILLVITLNLTFASAQPTAGSRSNLPMVALLPPPHLKSNERSFSFWKSGLFLTAAWAAVLDKADGEFVKSLDLWMTQLPQERRILAESKLKDLKNHLEGESRSDHRVASLYAEILEHAYSEAKTTSHHPLVVSARKYAQALEDESNNKKSHEDSSDTKLNHYHQFLGDYSEELRKNPKTDEAVRKPLDALITLSNGNQTIPDVKTKLNETYIEFSHEYQKALGAHPHNGTADVQDIIDVLNELHHIPPPSNSVCQVQVPKGKGHTLEQVNVKFGKFSEGGSFEKIVNHFQGRSADKKRLEAIRREGEKEFADLLQKTPAGHQADSSIITRKMTEKMKLFASDMVKEEALNLENQEAIKKLRATGVKPPKFAMFSMGSMPRGEAGFYTDLEVGFIIEKNTPGNQKYISQLTQRIADRVHLLGEEDGFHLDVADNAPLYNQFQDRYMDRDLIRPKTEQAILNRKFSEIPTRGTRLLVTTSEQLANYFDNSQIKKSFNTHPMKFENQNGLMKLPPGYDPKGDGIPERDDRKYWQKQSDQPYMMREKQMLLSLPVMLRNIGMVSGDEELFKKYLDERHQVLNKNTTSATNAAQHSLRQKIALESLNQSLLKMMNQGKGHTQGKVDKKIDLKRDLYRTVEQILTNLGFYYDTKSQNTIDIANELKARKIMPDDLAEKAENLVKFYMELRLKTQIKLKQQGKNVYLDSEQFDKDLKDLEDQIKELSQRMEEEESRKRTETDLHAKSARDLKEKVDKLNLDKTELLKSSTHLLDDLDNERIKNTLPIVHELFEFAVSWMDRESENAPRSSTAGPAKALK